MEITQIYSHSHIFGKTFVKATVFLKKLLNNWYIWRDDFSMWVNFSNFHTEYTHVNSSKILVRVEAISIFMLRKVKYCNLEMFFGSWKCILYHTKKNYVLHDWINKMKDQDTRQGQIKDGRRRMSKARQYSFKVKNAWRRRP